MRFHLISFSLAFISYPTSHPPPKTEGKKRKKKKWISAKRNPRFSRDRPRFHDALDAIKFVCKDLWMLVFRKQVDNLKTNHRGVYVLTDNSFRPLSRMSADAGGQAVARAQPVSCSLSFFLFLFLFPLFILPKGRKKEKRSSGSTDAFSRTKQFLWFPCGILRGALAAMGISATVQGETSELPGAVFQIKTIAAAK